MYNKIEIIGHLGKDPEMRYTPKGSPVTNFSVAVKDVYTDSDGERHETTLWFRATTWGNQAEACNQYLEKGSKVFVEGKLIADPSTGGPRVWGDDEAKANFEINAAKVVFLDGKSKEREGSPYDGDEAPRKAKPKPRVKKKEPWEE